MKEMIKLKDLLTIVIYPNLLRDICFLVIFIIMILLIFSLHLAPLVDLKLLLFLIITYSIMDILLEINVDTQKMITLPYLYLFIIVLAIF